MRNGFDARASRAPATNLKRPCDASHGAGIDVDGIDFAGSHDFFDLFVNAVESNALGGSISTLT